MPLTAKQLENIYTITSHGQSVIEKRADGQDWITIAATEAEQAAWDYSIAEIAACVVGSTFSAPLTTFLGMLLSPTEMGDGSLKKNELLSSLNVTPSTGFKWVGSGQVLLNHAIPSSTRLLLDRWSLLKTNTQAVAEIQKKILETRLEQHLQSNNLTADRAMNTINLVDQALSQAQEEERQKSLLKELQQNVVVYGFHMIKYNVRAKIQATTAIESAKESQIALLREAQQNDLFYSHARFGFGRRAHRSSEIMASWPAQQQVSQSTPDAPTPVDISSATTTSSHYDTFFNPPGGGSVTTGSGGDVTCGGQSVTTGGGAGWGAHDGTGPMGGDAWGRYL